MNEDDDQPPTSARHERSQKISSAGTSTAGPSRLPSPQDNGNEGGAATDPFEGMSEEDIFRIVTRPDEIEGVVDWGIPPAVDPAQASDALKVSYSSECGLEHH